MAIYTKKTDAKHKNKPYGFLISPPERYRKLYVETFPNVNPSIFLKFVYILRLQFLHKNNTEY